MTDIHVYRLVLNMILCNAPDYCTKPQKRTQNIYSPQNLDKITELLKFQGNAAESMTYFLIILLHVLSSACWIILHAFFKLTF